MASIALHVKTAQPLADTVGRAIALALRPVSHEIQTALEQAQPERAWRLARTTLAQVGSSLTGNASGGREGCLHLLAIEIAVSPLICLADGTLQEALEVWVEHRAWRVSPAQGRRLADQVVQRWNVCADVACSQRVSFSGHRETSAWAPLA